MIRDSKDFIWLFSFQMELEKYVLHMKINVLQVEKILKHEIYYNLQTTETKCITLLKHS